MVKLWLAEGFQLLGRFVEGRIVNCVAARTRQCEASYIYTLHMSDFSVLGEEEWPRWFGDHGDVLRAACGSGEDQLRRLGRSASFVADEADFLNSDQQV